jgi:uncharacterized membrane protein YhaH (DUF805 family)|tara:strand:- start:507 stop:896 length:390 start_codon:yes stop_codon:yes gene_type:complete
MNFVEATKCYFIKWIDFNTRISRSEFWWGNLGALIVSLLLGACVGFMVGVVGSMLGLDIDALLDLMMLPIQLFFSIAGISVIVRRLHDINKSGWWMLIVFTIVGIIVLLIWECQQGDEGENRFGPNPLD